MSLYDEYIYLHYKYILIDIYFNKNCHITRIEKKIFEIELNDCNFSFLIYWLATKHITT